MIEFKISGKEYKIEDVTIQQYYNIQDLIVRQDFAAKVEIVSRIANCEQSELKKLDKYQFIALWDAVVDNYLNLDDKASFHKNFVYKGELYGFLDMTKLTLGEFADMDVLKADPMSQKKLHVMMAILYRPAVQITDKWMEVQAYNGEEVMARAEVFLDLPIKYASGALNFFLAVSKYYVETTLSSLTLNPKTTLRQKAIIDLASQLISEQLEIGRRSSTTVQAMTLQKLEKLNELMSLESSTTSHTEKINNEKKMTVVDRWSFKIKDKLTWR